MRRTARRIGTGIQGVLAPRYRLPTHPWRLAESTPGEVVATVEGAFTSGYNASVYGDVPAPEIPPSRLRNDSLAIRRFENVTLYPQHLMIGGDGAVLPPSLDLLYHPAMREQWHQAGAWDLTDLPLGRHVERPVLFASPTFRGFGHTLMEVVPQLAALRHLPPETNVAVWWARDGGLFDACEVDRRRIVSYRGPLHCQTVYTIDPPLDLTGNIHSAAREMFDAMAERSVGNAAGSSGRIYLSRAGIAVRRLENEDEIERLFASHGFAIVRPETLPVADQIAMIRRAELVAGPVGSAMHLLVFASPSTRALLLSPTSHATRINLQIARSERQFGFVYGYPTEHRESRRLMPWRIDRNAVEAAIFGHFSL